MASSDRPAKKQKIVYEYHTTWNKQDRSAFSDFWKEWWGPASSGKQKLDHAKAQQDDRDRKIYIPQRQIWAVLNLLSKSVGWLLVRKEYQAMYGRLGQAYASDTFRVDGIVLTGQPGIGKSYFNVFALLEQMTEGRPVLFLSSSEEAYIFDEEGIWKWGETPAKISRLDFPERMWALIDGSEKKEPVSPSVANSWFFVVYATSPHEEKFRGYIKQEIHVNQWILQPWSDTEVLALLLDRDMAQLPQQTLSEHATQEGAEILVRDVGPCPRDIIRFLRDRTWYESRVATAVKTHEDCEALVQLMRNPFDAPNRFSHSLVLVQRCGVPNYQISDRYSIKFKTADIRSKMLDRLLSHEYYNMVRLFRACSGVGAHGAVMAGWLFEGFAMSFMSGNLPTGPSIFTTFMPMEPAVTRSTNFPYRFNHITGSNLVLNVDTKGGIHLQSPNPSQKVSQPPPASFPVKKRQMKKYEVVEAIEISGDYFYYPTRFNCPGFDCFFFDISDQKANIWMLQITIRKAHDGKVGEFDLVRSLQAAMVQRFPALAVNVNIKYLLVVPQGKSKGVQWDMAKDYKELQGDVFVQYLDVSGMDCDPELLIGCEQGDEI